MAKKLKKLRTKLDGDLLLDDLTRRIYATDASVTDNVTISGIFPIGSHPAIVYPAAMTAESTNKALGRQFRQCAARL